MEGHSVTLNTGLESFDDAGTPGHIQTNQMLDGQEMPGELLYEVSECFQALSVRSWNINIMDFCHTRPCVLQEASDTLQSQLQCLSV